MSAINTMPSVFPESLNSPHITREEKEEHDILNSLAKEALDDPQTSETAFELLTDTIHSLISVYAKTQNSTLEKTLEVSTECLNKVYEASAKGNKNAQDLVKKHGKELDDLYQQTIEGAYKKIFERVTSLPQQPLPPLQKEPSLDSRVATALKNGDDEALLAYIAKGASIKPLSQDDKNRLAATATVSFNDMALASLIRNGCTIFSPDGRSPILLEAVSNNLHESVKALIDRHANLHTSDADGNTALHRAFLLGSPKMALLLMPHIDPQSKNAQLQTPLQALLSPHPDSLNYLQLPEDQIPIFLEALFKKNLAELPGGLDSTKMRATQRLLMISSEKFPHFPVDIVEMAFLADDEDLNDVLFSEIDTETYLAACSRLENRYPKEDVARFMSTPYGINDFHYRMGGHSAPLRPLEGKKSPPLETFYTLFKTLNLSNPKAANYVDPIAWLNDNTAQKEELPTEGEALRNARQNAIKQLRDELEVVIGRIIRKETYAGVPAYQPEKWFQRIELYLKNILLTLQEKKDPALTIGVLKELRSTFPNCATGLTTTAINLYERLCFGIDSKDPQRAFLRSLANYRRQCFDDAVNSVHSAEVHHGHQALVLLGPELGLSGHEEAALYQDPYSYSVDDLDPQGVKLEFAKRYTPPAIVDWLLQALKANIDGIRDCYIDLHKCFMKPDWKSEHYVPILKKLKELEQEGSEKKRTAAIGELLAKNDIFKASPDQPPQRAIEEDCLADYLGHFVYDEEGGLRPQAAIYLLTCMGVIQPLLR